jgi:hypothetical protein
MVMLDAYSKLESPEEISEAMVEVMVDLFIDHEPQFDAAAEQITFRLFSTITKGGTGNDEFDVAIRTTWNRFDLPQSEWIAVVEAAELAALAKAIFESPDGPKTQILAAKTLELLVRDDTPIPNLRRRRNERPLTTTFDDPECRIQFVVGRASMALVMKAAICRDGLRRFTELFVRERLIPYLQSLEPPHATNSLPALRLVEELIHPDVLSLLVESTQDEDVEKLDEWATAFRGRLAYEASLIFSPVSDVNSLRPTYAQPPIVRQLGAERTHGSLPGDYLVGRVIKYDDECFLRYLRGVSALDTFAAYMSYYQIIEYHMEPCFAQALADRVRLGCSATLTIDDGREISELVDEASGLLGIPKKDLRFTEKRAIKAVINRHIDPLTLARDLMRHLESALDYFLFSSPDFADIQPVMLAKAGGNDDLLILELPDGTQVKGAEAHGKLCDQIAERIYEIRCTITHAKMSHRRYSPYRDDFQLAKEVPLVRLAAEQLLVSREDWL